MNKRYKKLIMVTGANNNKYYEMEWDGTSPSFSVKYGRVESTVQTGSYPIKDWDKKYNEKVKKGYKDVTDMFSVKEDDNKQVIKTGSTRHEQFLNLMQGYTNNLVQDTYSVSAASVTQAQIDEAQRLINSLGKAKENDSTKVNNILTDLYSVIPRYMRDVRDELLPRISLKGKMQREQDNLDAMAAKVGQIKSVAKTDKKEIDLLEMLGITMDVLNDIPKEIKYITDQIKGVILESLFTINQDRETKKMTSYISGRKNKSTEFLVHGTRATSLIPIIQTGNKIRPTGNFQFSGKAYGDGIYFSSHFQKSLGYTGSTPDRVMFIYEVHTGNKFVYEGWYRGNSFPLTYKDLDSRGFDSTFVKPGNGLQNSEYIVYNENQCAPKYILWLK